MALNKRNKRLCIGRRSHSDLFGAAADLDLLDRQRIRGQVRRHPDAVGNDRLAGQALGHVLQPGGDVDGIAKRRKHHVIPIADFADDHLAAMDPDAEADRLAQIMAEEPVQFLDIGRNGSRRRDRLSAGGLLIRGCLLYTSDAADE